MGFSVWMNMSKGFVLLNLLFCSFHIMRVVCIEFEVGGDKGWVIPPSKTDQLYNTWASKNRFNVNDTLHFEYKKDSVLVVTKEEYEKCHSTHPLLFNNNGNTIYELDRPGLFYFISGVSGHCERGLKMIIKVLEPENLPDQSANQTENSPHKKKNGAVALKLAGATSSPTLIIMMSFFGALFM